MLMNDTYIATSRTTLPARVSWSAISAGSLFAVALLVLFTTLGTAVGMSMQSRIATTGRDAVGIAWFVIIVGTALFVGGMITSLLIVGESKTESVIHGILMWALTLGILVFLGAVGARLHPLVDSSLFSASRPQITLSPPTNDTLRIPSTNETPQATEERARMFAWYAFGGTWLTMIAAAAGAYAGAGTTFRRVRVAPAV